MSAEIPTVTKAHELPSNQVLRLEDLPVTAAKKKCEEYISRLSCPISSAETAAAQLDFALDEIAETRSGELVPQAKLGYSGELNSNQYFEQAMSSVPSMSSQPVLFIGPDLSSQPFLLSEPVLMSEPVLSSGSLLSHEPALPSGPVLLSGLILSSEQVLSSHPDLLSVPLVYTEPPLSSVLIPTVTIDESAACCEVENCGEEVFAACPSCQIFMCYNHISTEYSSCTEHNSALKPVAIEQVWDAMSDCTEPYIVEVTTMPTLPAKKISVRKKVVAQKLRQLGKSYEGMDKSKKGVIKSERSLGIRCNHTLELGKTSRSLRCGEVNNESREQSFKDFWNLESWTAKRSYLRGIVDTRPAIQRRKQGENAEKLKRNKVNFHDFYLRTAEGRRVLVCRPMFLATFAIGEDQLRRWTSSRLLNEVLLSAFLFF